MSIKLKKRKPLTPFEYRMKSGRKPEAHTSDIAAEIIDRLRFNTGPVVTLASRKSIKYGIEQFTINPHPFQMFYCIKYLERSRQWNVAINMMIIHLRYLMSWRYFFRLIGHRQHHVSDLYKLAISGNSDVANLFIYELPKVHSHKDFIKFMWDVRATLDFDEMLALNRCARFWSKYTESYTDKKNDLFWGQLAKDDE